MNSPKAGYTAVGGVYVGDLLYILTKNGLWVGPVSSISYIRQEVRAGEAGGYVSINYAYAVFLLAVLADRTRGTLSGLFGHVSYSCYLNMVDIESCVGHITVYAEGMPCGVGRARYFFFNNKGCAGYKGYCVVPTFKAGETLQEYFADCTCTTAPMYSNYIVIACAGHTPGRERNVNGSPRIWPVSGYVKIVVAFHACAKGNVG